jgi:hypothetical protein
MRERNRAHSGQTCSNHVFGAMPIKRPPGERVTHDWRYRRDTGATSQHRFYLHPVRMGANAALSALSGERSPAYIALYASEPTRRNGTACLKLRFQDRMDFSTHRAQKRGPPRIVLLRQVASLLTGPPLSLALRPCEPARLLIIVRSSASISFSRSPNRTKLERAVDAAKPCSLESFRAAVACSSASPISLRS